MKTFFKQFLAIDKIAHALAGALILMFIAPILISFGCGILPVFVISLCVVFSAGLGKEVWDYYHPAHTCDGLDLLATMVGGVVGVILAFIQFLLT